MKKAIIIFLIWAITCFIIFQVLNYFIMPHFYDSKIIKMFMLYVKGVIALIVLFIIEKIMLK